MTERRLYQCGEYRKYSEYPEFGLEKWTSGNCSDNYCFRVDNSEVGISYGKIRDTDKKDEKGCVARKRYYRNEES